MSRNIINWKTILQISWKKILSGVVMLAVVWRIGQNHSGSVLITLIQAASGALVYALMMILIKDEFMTATIKHFRSRRK